jgi:all-trans-retinol 13,14-reductase
MTGQALNPAEFDAILIGSGMGALTVASLLAKFRNQRVLVVERHFQPGGMTHEFSRGQFRWDVGLHEVGSMNAWSPVRKVFDLVVDRQVNWNRTADPFDRFIYPNLTFDFYSGAGRFQQDLISRFPAEASGIRRYLQEVRRAAFGYKSLLLQRNGSGLLRCLGQIAQRIRPARWQRTTGEVLNQHIRDPELRSLLASQWCYYGLPPAVSPFPLHALIVDHYLNGAYYPEGGAGTIAAAVQKIVESRGGLFVSGQRVTEIILRDGRAIGIRACHHVRSDRTTEYFAPVIISDAGAATTYLDLISEKKAVPFRADLLRFVSQTFHASHVAVYLGFNQNPAALGLTAASYCVFESPDHDGAFQRLKNGPLQLPPPCVFMTLPSMKTRTVISEAAIDNARHTACLIVPAHYAHFEAWKSQPWYRRDKDYQDLKDTIAESAIGLVERRFPGFSSLVEYREVSTPITTEHFTGHHHGAIYGLPGLAERFEASAQAWTSPKSHIPGLYLTGSDVFSPGIVGAMFGGVLAMSHLPEGVSSARLLLSALAQR